MKRRASIDELSIVKTDDEDTKSERPLIEKPVGAITYEHCLAERFYKDIYMATAERNYYVDQYHELCLCAHYNRRVPGEYRFEEGYQFFVTKKRMCLDIYWNLGNISDKRMIIEHYDSMDDAKKSKYYRDFCDLKKMIENGIMWRKTHYLDPFRFTGGSSFQYGSGENGRRQYTIHEIPIFEKKEIAQFYLNNDTEIWEMMSISSEPLSDLMRFFKDFDDLDREELHLRRFISMESEAFENEMLYKKAFDSVKASHEFSKNVEYR